MKRIKNFAFPLCAVLLTALLLSACSGYAPGPRQTPTEYFIPSAEAANVRTELAPASENGAKTVVENPFVDTAIQPVSTFSGDVDTASYTMMRKMIDAGYNFRELKATAGRSLRTEEMVNYFDYDCPAPDGALFGVKATVAPNPYNAGTFLMKLTLRAEDAPKTEKNNFVFLIDVSGSMSQSDKLPLLKKAFRTLTAHLTEDDTVSIVTYSGREAVVLDGCPGSSRETVLDAIDSLVARGSTNGEAGLKKAYELAEKHFLPDGNNRIILASDGDLNVGISSEKELEAFVEGKRASGVFLSVLGFGTGNFRDANMEAIADHGNGVYYYIDGDFEAEKVFSADLFKSLYTVAKDVKLQVTFSPERVSAYRLIGYENRLLDEKDFENDTKDAGDLGAGALITVFYELRLAGGSTDSDFARLSLRAKQPDGIKSILEEYAITKDAYTDAPDDDFLFASAVVELSLCLLDSTYKGASSPEHLLSRVSALDLKDDPLKTQFVELVKKLLQA